MLPCVLSGANDVAANVDQKIKIAWSDFWAVTNVLIPSSGVKGAYHRKSRSCGIIVK
jgi:hypothetical protein